VPQRSEVHTFDITAIPGLSDKAQEAVKDVFEAMTAWQSETAKVGERHGKQVFDKMATAAAALGWPEQIVDAARAQMQSIAEMQSKTIEHVRQAWEEQLKLPSAAPEAMMSRLKSPPGFGAGGHWPNAEALQAAMTSPFGLWMEFGKQWQKFWMEAMERATKH
jgi:hypothetical protein